MNPPIVLINGWAANAANAANAAYAAYAAYAANAANAANTTNVAYAAYAANAAYTANAAYFLSFVMIICWLPCLLGERESTDIYRRLGYICGKSIREPFYV